jgi:hypothetical protein
MQGRNAGRAVEERSNPEAKLGRKADIARQGVNSN